MVGFAHGVRIDYVARKVVKGRAVADFLAQNPVDNEQEWELEFPDEHLGVNRGPDLDNVL